MHVLGIVSEQDQARPADALAAGGDLPNLVLGTMPYVEGAARRLGVNMLLLSN
jgi:hypothetical protein